MEVEEPLFFSRSSPPPRPVSPTPSRQSLAGGRTPQRCGGTRTLQTASARSARRPRRGSPQPSYFRPSRAARGCTRVQKPGPRARSARGPVFCTRVHPRAAREGRMSVCRPPGHFPRALGHFFDGNFWKLGLFCDFAIPQDLSRFCTIFWRFLAISQDSARF